MRKVLTFVLIFSGTVFAVFVLNIVMYALIPGYHDTIASAFGKDEIPVVSVSTVIENEPVPTERQPMEEVATKPENDLVFTSVVSEHAENDYEPIIIDREYHEDCGTGKGYWVLTYDDGTIVVE
jgi:hypothetical protein